MTQNHHSSLDDLDFDLPGFDLDLDLSSFELDLDLDGLFDDDEAWLKSAPHRGAQGMIELRAGVYMPSRKNERHGAAEPFAKEDSKAA